MSHWTKHLVATCLGHHLLADTLVTGLLTALHGLCLSPALAAARFRMLGDAVSENGEPGEAACTRGCAKDTLRAVGGWLFPPLVLRALKTPVL